MNFEDFGESDFGGEDMSQMFASPLHVGDGADEDFGGMGNDFGGTSSLPPLNDIGSRSSNSFSDSGFGSPDQGGNAVPVFVGSDGGGHGNKMVCCCCLSYCLFLLLLFLVLCGVAYTCYKLGDIHEDIKNLKLVISVPISSPPSINPPNMDLPY